MTSLPILLVGAGGHARACIDVIEMEGRFKILGLVGLPGEVGTSVLGYPVIGTDAEVPDLLRECVHALVTLGQIRNWEERERLFALLVRDGRELPVIVSPRAYVSPHAKLGRGTIVMHGAIVNANAEVGVNCIINSQALVEHDSVVGNHCHVATAVAINSGVRVGRGTFIGSNSSVRQGAVIGERCTIGIGQRVLEGCASGLQMPPGKGAS